MSMYSIIVTIVAIALLIGMAMGMSGCSATAGPYAPLKQAVITTDAAVVTGTDLRASNKISKDDVQVLLLSSKSLLSSEIAWKASLDTGDTNAASIALTSVNSGLKVLSDQLIILQRTKNLPLNTAAGRARLKLELLQKDYDGKIKKLDPASTLAIIQLIADLSPKMVDWINAMTSKTAVTSSEVGDAIASLQRDIAVLETAAN